jgi:hypothetical protein
MNVSKAVLITGSQTQETLRRNTFGTRVSRPQTSPARQGLECGLENELSATGEVEGAH